MTTFTFRDGLGEFTVDTGGYKTTYDYDNPHGAGPYKGSMTTPGQYKRGDHISAPFGSATVRSSRKATRRQEA